MQVILFLREILTALSEVMFGNFFLVKPAKNKQEAIFRHTVAKITLRVYIPFKPDPCACVTNFYGQPFPHHYM